jgi:glycosyltransferase involved in cell wall biosynthesis
MTKSPLVSVVVPTYNSNAMIAACLTSITQQTYPNIELIVVDNHSGDNTAEIARTFTDKVFIKGPERSAQRNYGVDHAAGAYVCIIDSDMELSPDVIQKCVEALQSSPSAKGAVIPEESFGEGFWAECKRLERSFYVGVDWMEAARFFDIKTYKKLGGYDANLVSGEDWDLSQRVAAIGPLVHIEALIYHNEGRLRLRRTLSKKYYYAKQITHYLAKTNHTENISKQTSPVGRFGLFLKSPAELLKKPHVGIGMLFMKCLEFGAGAIGVMAAKRNKKEATDGSAET